jgi:hypothetical protein
VAELQTEMRQVREEIDRIQDRLIDLSHKLELQSERERFEREKLAMAMENALLRIERRLPPATEGK